MNAKNKMRIDKYISSQIPGLSRTDVKKLISEGRVTLNGETVDAPEMKIFPGCGKVCVDGETVIFREHLYLMLNKPKGYVCDSRSDGAPNVLSLVPEELRRSGLFPAGRLDKDTEGFVLITDDGELAHRMLAPVSHVPKTYLARLRDPCEESYIQTFGKGVLLSNGERCRPAKLYIDDNNRNICTVVISEGKYHQIKRMFEKVGNKVVYLKRTAIGNLPLSEKLASGECLEILHKDVEKLLCKKN